MRSRIWPKAWVNLFYRSRIPYVESPLPKIVMLAREAHHGRRTTCAHTHTDRAEPFEIGSSSVETRRR